MALFTCPQRTRDDAAASTANQLCSGHGIYSPQLPYAFYPKDSPEQRNPTPSCRCFPGQPSGPLARTRPPAPRLTFSHLKRPTFSHHHTRTACEELARVTVGTLARSARCEQTTWRGRTSASTTARGEARACRWRWCCAGVVVAWQVASGHPNLRDQPPLWAGRGLPAVAVETRARTRFRTELVPLREGRVGHRLLARPGDFRPEEIAEYRRERSPAHLRVRDAAALHHVSSSRHIRSAHSLGAYLSAYLGVYLGA